MAAAASTLSSAARAALKATLARLAPGVALSAAVALAATVAAPGVARLFPVPAIVIALVIGIALNGLALRPLFAPGLTWCVKTLLRGAIGLLGIRIALSDIVDLGWPEALLVIAGMGLTILSGVWFARLLRVGDGYGVLAGAATAVCGASATLATATVVPNYPQKGADVAFTVVAANIVSTLVMIAYPALCLALGFDAKTTGVLLGATIHDMAQVVGAGYAVSEPVGNTAVIVKLFRVFLLLPVVLGVGVWFARRTAGGAGRARVPVPVFALVFLGLCVLNSLASSLPALAPVYGPLKGVLVAVSAWGLLVAIAALGLGTSPRAILAIGWRHVAVFCAATLVLLAVVTTGLLALS